jgi:hypothetical protein
MDAARTRYEVRVGTLMSDATLSTFRLGVETTTVPRETLYRFRVRAGRDLADVLGRLIEEKVQVLEIRLCPDPPCPDRVAAPVADEAAPQATSSADGVVVPIRAATGSGRSGNGTAPGRRSSGQARRGRRTDRT